MVKELGGHAEVDKEVVERTVADANVKVRVVDVLVPVHGNTAVFERALTGLGVNYGEGEGVLDAFLRGAGGGGQHSW